jgi:hypothetical protein
VAARRPVVRRPAAADLMRNMVPFQQTNVYKKGFKGYQVEVKHFFK